MNLQMQKPEGMVVEELNGPYHSRFILNPLEEGYGVTIGNALRRVLLSSIQGAAIVGVRISGVQHEFQTVQGVVEDMCEIILNLKEVRLRIDSAVPPQRIVFQLKGADGTFTAAHIGSATPEVTVLDPSKRIATLASDCDLEVELRVGRGKGYIPSEEQNTTDYPVGMLPIDAIYTPIKNVVFTVEPFRVGQKTDYEKLIVDVTTDGSITAREAVQQAAEIIQEHVALLISVQKNKSIAGKTEESAPASEGPDKETIRIRRILQQSVDELELSVRAHNCLKAAGIKTMADLVVLTENDLLKFRNFGRKSLQELHDVVNAHQLNFGFDVPKYLRDEPALND
jgi:DNA-directed RNA polymerase subunit alpha